jgi:acylphosphatase
MPTIQLLVKGRVQGVFYRATAQEVAQKIGLGGWIRNTGEGDVEALVTGNEDQLQQFIQWCHKGPSEAIVTSVDVLPQPDQVFDGFRIRRGS